MYITLQKREKEHVTVFWEKTRDEEIQKLFPFTTNSLEKSLRLFDESVKEDALSYGKVIYYDNKYIGDIWCYCIDESNKKMAMLSIVIFEKELWGKGIATIAAKKFIEEVFNKYHIIKIGAFTYSNNYGSIGLLQNNNFVEVDTFIEDGIASKYYELKREGLINVACN
ncbi:GNAT family N-acetyltransferase [Inconstantimicrobium mannanitabidum]|uniref:Uncharacterized protein n=1 Tax=Inconstantimicrobium mannanitabidum TaxID=1604901 RepID=A0ACB5RCK7_9CLOT|nr:GNAT family N-acetyltransferase [Clostridium sp. TW13]GKX66466.1 hypothetical protein rsdtw13_17240 [Clostridium sp. TW13]